MKKIKITKDASKAWSGLDAKQYKQIGATIMDLLQDPMPHDSQQLKGALNGERRVDMGEYRIIYAIVDDVIEILVIGKRNRDEVYKKWGRKSK